MAIRSRKPGGGSRRLRERISARACHGMDIDIDMDDPEIARAMLAMTFDALFGPPTPNRKTKRDCYQSSTP